MTQAVILDTETTGLHEPDVIQLACKGPLEFSGGWQHAEVSVQHFKPRKPISIGAMATHRIIADDLESYVEWPGSWEVPAGVEYLVGHGIDFDWEAIGFPDVKRIDTLALAKRHYPDLDSYKLAALMYHLYVAAVARDMTGNAHSASTDIALTELLLDHLITEINGKFNISGRCLGSWEELWLLSEDARIPLRFDFGKYGPRDGQLGLLYTEVPHSYLRWMCCQPDMDQYKLLAAQRALGEYRHG